MSSRREAIARADKERAEQSDADIAEFVARWVADPAPLAVCGECGAGFMPIKAGQQFCSVPCRKKAHNRRSAVSSGLPQGQIAAGYELLNKRVNR